MARLSLRNSRRAVARRGTAGELVDTAIPSAATAPDLDEALDVRAAVAALAPDDAELVRLIYWDGLRSHEAAEVLGINASTARSRLSLVRQQLRRTLDPVESALSAQE